MRCLILSDIHSNLEAFEAVLSAAGPVEQVWCLGDLTGYGPDPNACVERLRSLPHVCIAGNHDWAVVGKLDLDDFNPDARAANLWTRKQLTADNRGFLEGLPSTRTEGQFFLAHGSPCHPIWEYVSHPAVARAGFDCFDTPFCLVGHTHAPAVFWLREAGEAAQAGLFMPPSGERLGLGPERLIINPGGVGQPRDGDPRASFLVLDAEALTVEYRRVDYPIEKTQDKMLRQGLPRRLAARLAHGW